MRDSCLPLSFHQKRGATEKGWVQNRPFSFEWKALILIGRHCNLYSQLSKCFGLNKKIVSLTKDTEDRRRMPPPPRQPHPGVNGGTGSSAADTPTPPPPLPDAPPPMETPPTPAAAASRLDMLVGGGSSMKSQPTSRLVYEQVCIRNSN